MNEYKGLSYNALVGSFVLGRSLLGYTGAENGAIFQDVSTDLSASVDLPAWVEAGEDPLAQKYDLGGGGVKRIVVARRQIRRFVAYAERAMKALLENTFQNAEKVSYIVKVDGNVEDAGYIVPKSFRATTKTGRVWRVELEGWIAES